MIDDDSSLTREERLALEDEGYVVGHPDHEDVQRVAVDDWEHVLIRVTGVDDDYTEAVDGVDIPLEPPTTDDSVVELVVKGDVVARMIQTGGDHA